jgi:hypothetical protein
MNFGKWNVALPAGEELTISFLFIRWKYFWDEPELRLKAAKSREKAEIAH